LKRTGIHRLSMTIPVLAALAVVFSLQACRREPLPDTVILDLGKDTQMTFHLIPEGSFFMGSRPGEGQRSAVPRHEVYLDDFHMGVFEVTNRQFSRFVEKTGYLTTVEQQSREGKKYGVCKDGQWGPRPGVGWSTPEGEGSTIKEKMDHPVIHISWYDADAFCRWLTAYSGMKVCIPTEAQWEKTARGGDDSLIYPWGNEISPDLANVEIPGLPGWGTVPVDRYRPNHYGLYHLGGNISEWTRDWFKKDYYQESPFKNPRGPEAGSSKNRRGGHWKLDPEWECKITSRRPYHPSRNNYYLVGFRCAIEPDG